MTTAYDKITNGRDFNFYSKISVTNSSFQDNCDTIITFATKSATFHLIGSGVIQYSFNGNTVHGEMDSSNESKTLIFNDRTISKIWLKLISGGPVSLRIEAWG